ncbi:MAG: methyltransferase domain-containing protein [Acidobacteriaceae bacterium]|nr:methyltransferase domain-containing protein [Acidobacteriaceae bacterium]
MNAWSQSPPKNYWDQVYSGTPIFSLKPTALVMTAVVGRRPGKALDIGMGQGRNAIFLAQNGWDVTGFDPSQEGVRQAKEQAARLGLPLRAIVAAEEDFDLLSSHWDLIVMTYVRKLRTGDAERFSAALNPKGLFVYENNNVGGLNESLREFLKFRILRFEDVDAESDWHPQRKQRVERLIAQKAE